MKHYLAQFFKESNDIEGYNFTLQAYEEALQAESLDDISFPHIRNTLLAWNYIHNVRDPLAHEHVKECHGILMRGLLEPADCGEYRDVRVWVGNNPCLAPEHIHVAMDCFLQRYNTRKINAMDLHYEFETVHPFIDGNGRVGRLIWAADILRRGECIVPILDCFDWEHTGIFNVKRANYYDAIQSYRSEKTFK